MTAPAFEAIQSMPDGRDKPISALWAKMIHEGVEELDHAFKLALLRRWLEPCPGGAVAHEDCHRHGGGCYRLTRRGWAVAQEIMG